MAALLWPCMVSAFVSGERGAESPFKGKLSLSRGNNQINCSAKIFTTVLRIKSDVRKIIQTSFLFSVRPFLSNLVKIYCVILSQSFSFLIFSGFVSRTGSETPAV